MERYDIGDLIKIGLRRFFWMFIPFCIVLTIGLLSLEFIPERYQSKALLIVESQQVSEELVPSAVRAYAEDRLQTIKAELRARDNVISLAEKYDLIERDSDIPFSERVNAVRNDIRISINSIDDRRRRRSGSSAITFEIGYIHENPRTAFRVANQLVTDFLAENVEARIEAAEGTAAFLRDEEDDLRRKLAEIQQQIIDVRNANPGITPEAANITGSLIQRLEAEITRLEDRIEGSNQDLDMLRMQQPLLIDAQEQNDAERVQLREKRRALTALKLRYTDAYPEVVTLTEEVLDLEARLEPETFRPHAAEVLASLDKKISEGEDSLSERELSVLRDRRDNLRAQMQDVEGEVSSRSLAALQYEAREQALVRQIESYEERLVEAREELRDAENRLARSPAVGARIATLSSEERRLQGLLDQTQRSRAQAERSENLETQQKAERVVILEAPVLPDVPSTPDKPQLATMLVGAAGGLAAVIGLGPVLLLPRVETRRQLSQSLPGVPVIEVPEIVDEEERKFRRAVFVGLVTLSVVLTTALAFVASRVLLSP